MPDFSSMNTISGPSSITRPGAATRNDTDKLDIKSISNTDKKELSNFGKAFKMFQDLDRQQSTMLRMKGRDSNSTLSSRQSNSVSSMAEKVESKAQRAKSAVIAELKTTLAPRNSERSNQNVVVSTDSGQKPQSAPSVPSSPPPPPPPPPPPALQKTTTSPKENVTNQDQRNDLLKEIRASKGKAGLKKVDLTSKQPAQQSSISSHNPVIDGMSEKGKQLLFENPDQILDQADQLPDADKKAITAFTSKMIVHAAKPDILGELKKQIGHLPANEVTEKHISAMPKYCQDYFSVIRPYTHDIHTSAPFGNALCRKAEKENYQKIDAGSEMRHLKDKVPQRSQKGQQQTQWQSVAEVLEKLQINKRLEATSWHEKSGTVVRTPKESRSVFAEAEEKASKSLDNETRSELLKNNYKSQVTAALKEDPIFSGLFAKIDKDAAKELESEFRESIKNPETLEKSVGEFVLNKLQTQCKAFTYVGLTAENKSLQQEIERLKAQLTSR
ncbi:hypothetical protein MHN79_07900 [Vibrio sp. Of14-4]|uniref:hypothetical protein n=1 Tax=Vibrio sp. Of14-4 TaxID=2724878 RepID=UPI001EF29D47|nr:hypothetical protein [Vibrio sp. Of14-4]MCG7489411.1 hypothetical protein [Vibrio sp. Of14-4]